MTLHPIPWAARCCGNRGGLCESTAVVPCLQLCFGTTIFSTESASLSSYCLSVVAKLHFKPSRIFASLGGEQKTLLCLCVHTGT